MHHQMQLAALNAVPPHLQGQRPGPPPANSPQHPQAAHMAGQKQQRPQQQHQTVHYKPLPPPQTQTPPGNLQPLTTGVRPGPTPPPPSEDSPNSVDAESPQQAN